MRGAGAEAALRTFLAGAESEDEPEEEGAGALGVPVGVRTACWFIVPPRYRVVVRRTADASADLT